MRHSKLTFSAVLTALAILFASPAAAVEVSLKGSPNSMVRQNSVAKKLGYEFVKSPEELPVLVDTGEFVPLPGNDDYVVLESVSYPYARPEVRLFIERLAAQYREDTGEKLVVTSLTRPTSEQPRNSHQLSVHPAGIAIDLRISERTKSRQWLESVLLKLERQNLLDITRERRPPHYHVAIFPKAYKAHVEGLIGAEALAEAMKFELPVEEEIIEEPAKAAESAVVTAAMAVPAIERETFSWRHVGAVAAPLLAALFFGLGYWRGIARTRKQPSEDESWPNFTVSTTR